MRVAGKSGNYYLIIDQGNTLLKAALFVDNELLNLYTVPTKDYVSIKAIIHDLLKGYTAIKYGIVSSVAQEIVPVTEWFGQMDWLIFDHTTSLPVNNQYHSPATLGKDRLAGVVAAAEMFPQKDVLVIDAGTAITYDFVTSGRVYRGGSIAPGLSLRFKALNHFTGRLPLLETEVFNELSGADTRTSILSGVMTGTRLELEGFIAEYKALYPELQVLITGGDAKYFDKMLKFNIFAAPNLVLIGLKLILQHNIEK